MLDGLRIQPLDEGDWSAVRAIYEEGIATGDATFEDAAPDWDTWDRSNLASCRLVARNGADVVGWAALSSVSDRCVYGGVAEASVYVAASHRGKGIGRALIGALIHASETAGIWTLQAGIFPENETSLALCHSVGFRTVGRRERLGRHNGAWRDVLLLERRSTSVGR